MQALMELLQIAAAARPTTGSMRVFFRSFYDIANFVVVLSTNCACFVIRRAHLSKIVRRESLLNSAHHSDVAFDRHYVYVHLCTLRDKCETDERKNNGANMCVSYRFKESD